MTYKRLRYTTYILLYNIKYRYKLTGFPKFVIKIRTSINLNENYHSIW